MLIWTIVAIVLVAGLSSELFALSGQARQRNRAEDAWSLARADFKHRHAVTPKIPARRGRYTSHESGVLPVTNACAAGLLSSTGAGASERTGNDGLAPGLLGGAASPTELAELVGAGQKPA
jgi:hypothetical protein